MNHSIVNGALAITRFNNHTWNCNKRWRERNNWTGCIYGTPVQISEKLPTGAKIYILEMNNDSNIIEGIGVIKNKLYNNNGKRVHIYDDKNYNRYTYKSPYRIDKSDFINLTDNQIKLIRILEILIFKGSKHMKRGQGISIIPPWILFNENKSGMTQSEYNNSLVYKVKLLLLFDINSDFTKKILENNKLTILLREKEKLREKYSLILKNLQSNKFNFVKFVSTLFKIKFK